MEDDGAAGESCSPLDKPAAAPDTTLARLDRVINDVISDHGLQGTSKQSAGDFTRKVGCVQIATALLRLIDRSLDGRNSTHRRIYRCPGLIRQVLWYPPRRLERAISFSKISQHDP